MEEEKEVEQIWFQWKGQCGPTDN